MPKWPLEDGLRTQSSAGFTPNNKQEMDSKKRDASNPVIHTVMVLTRWGFMDDGSTLCNLDLAIIASAWNDATWRGSGESLLPV